MNNEPFDSIAILLLLEQTFEVRRGQLKDLKKMYPDCAHLVKERQDEMEFNFELVKMIIEAEAS